uniref:PDZ domain-containing protein n=1 Tax=Meleagris gallopavo TaxID=9103 RepID=A0A803XZE8_MELGA
HLHRKCSPSALRNSILTLKTEVEAGASGFSVAGGGNEGIFIKKVLKESPASKVFSLREGDQLLSATIFFDNIKYEDALKILQYSEPYRVQFSLKRKISGKEELEHFHSTAQYKKERLNSKIDVEYTVKKDPTEERNKKRSDRSSKIEIIAKKGEKDVDGKESKQRLPKFKLPTFTWGTTKDETLKHEIPVSETMTASAPKVDASLPEAEVKAGAVDISISAPDIKPPSVEGSLDLQAPKVDLKVPSAEGSLDGAELEAAGLKGKFKMPKFDKPKFGVSVPKAEGPEGEVSLPTAEVELPSGTVTVTGEGPSLDLKADVSGAKTEGAGWKLEKPSLKMPKADIKAPKVDISLPSVDITLPKAGVDLQAPEAALSLEGRQKTASSKCPSSACLPLAGPAAERPRGTVAADVDVSLKEPQVTAPSGTAEVDVTLPGAEIQAPGAEVTIEAAAGADAEKGRFKMPDVKMPSVKLPKVKAPHVQVSLPKAEISLPKAQGEIPEGELALQGPDAEGSLDVAAGKAEGGGMKLHMPKVKVPSVAFSKPTVKAPKVDVDVSVPKVDASLPEAEVKAGAVDISISAPDIKPPSVEGSLDLQAPKVDLKVPSAEGSLDGAELEAAGLKGKFKMPKFDKPKFGVSVPKAEGPEGEVSLPTAEVKLPSGTVTVTGEGPSLDLKADVSGAKTEGAGWKLEKPSLKMPKVKSPEASVERISSEIAMSSVEIKVEGPEGKTKMSKFQMPKFGMTNSKGKGSEKEVSQTKSEAKVPQLKATIEIADIAVEAPNLEVECTEGKESSSSKLKITKAEKKASEADTHFPMGEISISKTDSDIQDSDMVLKIKEETKHRNEDGEEKEGHFKMPKFKLPSFSWSPKKEATVKADSEANLEDNQVAVSSGGIDTEVEGTVADDQGPRPAVDLEIPAGKDQQKSPIKKPQFVMPKISLSKIKIPKSQGHSLKVEAGSTVTKTERDGVDSIQIPDIERSHSTQTEEGAQISIKTAAVKIPTLELSKTEAFQADLGISSPKLEAELPQLKMTAEVADITGRVPASEFTSDMADPGLEVCASKAKTPQVLTAVIEAPKVDISPQSESKAVTEGHAESLKEKEIKTEEEMKAEEAQTEEHQGWFKMPKFRIPAFGRTSLKEKKGDTDVERSLEKPQAGIPSAKVQTEAEITIGKEETPKLGDSVESSV